MMATCSVEQCQERATHRGMCRKHYRRFMSHGDALGGRTMQGAPMAFFRDVVLAHKGNACLTWPYSRTPEGYAKIWLDGRYQLASRVICKIERGPPPTEKHEAAHSCGNGMSGCVAPSHLDWATHIENEADKLAHGTRNRGERHGRAKLTLAQVVEIKGASGTSVEIAARFNVSPSTISRIRRGEGWL